MKITILEQMSRSTTLVSLTFMQKILIKLSKVMWVVLIELIIAYMADSSAPTIQMFSLIFPTLVKHSE